MTTKLQELCDLDSQLIELLNIDSPETEEIVAMVDKRDKLVQIILQEVKSDSSMTQSKLWDESIKRTKFIIERMNDETSKLGQQLRRYRHGNKSVQQYKKFI
ncbi:flagellar protein FliT [Vibrio maerlii]|uniref:flagellar protein FliT n=1 Tax=Vibrio maerlii TaxID=2231648 RepID=UPI000E3B866D|nr:flagellar protein FliT [Vibrio maerlii]